jgi:acyl-coenzyme A thioesterase 13
MNKTLEFLKQQIGKDSAASPSPLMRWLNPTLLAVEEGKVTLQYVVRNEMTNPMGNMHGGITAAIVDDAIGVTVFSLGESVFYTTITNSIDYFSSVKEKDSVIAETLIIKKGRQLINAQCEIWNADKSRLMAKGYSNLIKTDIPK